MKSIKIKISEETYAEIIKLMALQQIILDAKTRKTNCYYGQIESIDDAILNHANVCWSRQIKKDLQEYVGMTKEQIEEYIMF